MLDRRGRVPERAFGADEDVLGQRAGAVAALDEDGGAADFGAQAARGGDIVIGRHENGRRGAGDIAIHSLRMGNECGTHTIIISTNSQTLTFEHRAENRELFAEGALQAVRFTVGRGAGLYTMDDAVNG